ncbi:hypothetical protein KC19_6G186000 [Ceratodon purpureus]|uniref:Uncharacterized protein n=1 Tax=Ceratodon purpureus TaxID=3225 RepID=A0A8T0HIS0_CERPU|nr:hypothetical protein KC19_6G186000 [Ceratodon purpureus]
MMDIEAFAATLTILTLALLMGASGDYVAQPDCSVLEPSPCTPLTVLDENGDVSYDEYEESCPYHICTAIQPVYPPISNSSSKMSMIGDQRWSNDFSRGSAHAQIHHGDAKSSAEFTSTKDSYQKDVFSVHYDAFAPWFCSGSNLNFTARVEANTGYPPGKKEDLHAQCQYEQLLDSQTLGDCRHMRFTCADCSDMYRNWLCAIAFPRCYPEKTVTTYPVYNASDPSTVGTNGLVPTKIFGILKPCRGLCWAVIQKCQQYPNFNCPLSDTRDYGDYPNCNAFGFDQEPDPYAKSIYW